MAESEAASDRALWGAGTLLVTHDSGGGAMVADRTGTALASCDGNGALADASGAPLLSAPITVPPRAQRSRATDVAMEITNPAGAPLGRVSVRDYKLTPRSRRMTIDVSAAGGEPTGRIEARDKRGNELGVEAGEQQVAEVRIEEVKQGFLRRSRVYTVEVTATPLEPLQLPLLAAIVRYEALHAAVAEVLMRDR